MSDKNKIANLIEDHIDVLYKLDRAGIKNINTALDYLAIIKVHQMYSKLNDKKKQKKETAEQCHVSIRTVELALQLLGQDT